MSKILKIAAVVVAVVAITVATGGLGTPAAASTASTVTLASTGATIGIGAAATSASILGVSIGALTAVSAGLSIASALLAKRPTPGSAIGSPVDWKADPNAPLPYWIGRTMSHAKILVSKDDNYDRDERAGAEGWSAYFDGWGDVRRRWQGDGYRVEGIGVVA